MSVDGWGSKLQAKGDCMWSQGYTCRQFQLLRGELSTSLNPPSEERWLWVAVIHLHNICESNSSGRTDGSHVKFFKILWHILSCLAHSRHLHVRGGSDSNRLFHNTVRCLEVKSLTGPMMVGVVVGLQARLAEWLTEQPTCFSLHWMPRLGGGVNRANERWKEGLLSCREGVREHEFVAEPISMFSKISLTKLGSLGDREKVRARKKHHHNKQQ